MATKPSPGRRSAGRRLFGQRCGKRAWSLVPPPRSTNRQPSIRCDRPATASRRCIGFHRFDVDHLHRNRGVLDDRRRGHRARCGRARCCGLSGGRAVSSATPRLRAVGVPDRRRLLRTGPTGDLSRLAQRAVAVRALCPASGVGGLGHPSILRLVAGFTADFASAAAAQVPRRVAGLDG